MTGYEVALALLLVFAMPSVAQAERHYFTAAKLATMRKNVEAHKWAQAQRDGILVSADRWLKYDDEKLRTLVVPPCVPRGYQVHNFGCPVHGVEVHAKGLYKWIIDFDNPYKITCPVGGEEYPSNDFGAFLASGMEDRSLLTGEYADDGWGWNKEGDKANYWFVAYYAHWIMLKQLLPGIRDLGTAVVLVEHTDEQKARIYAHKCGLLLWQLAHHYPDYKYEKQSREAKEHNPNYTGKLTNMIWEVQTPQACAVAYDAVRPYLARDDSLQALSGLAGTQLDAVIRERLLMQAARDIMNNTGRIRGNYGMHQEALALLSAALQETEQHPTSQEMVDWIVSNPSPQTQSCLGLRDALESLMYRDGMPFESIAYNLGWISHLSQVAGALTETGINYFENPRFRKLLMWPFDVLIDGQFVPPLGDTGNMFAKGSSLSPSIARMAVRHFPDPRIVEVLRENPGRGNDLFQPPSEELLAGLGDTAAARTGPEAMHLPAYGLAYLGSGGEANRTTSVLSYGDYPGHAHADQLNLLLFSHDNALLTDIGYPEQTDAFNHKRYAFFSNTVAHNTVVVNARRQGRGPGRLYAYEPNGFAQVVDASCEGAYAGVVDLYRRANILVELSPTQSYLFDAFYVRGGAQHDYVALGPPSKFESEPPLGPMQQEGTLAGEDVPYEHFYDDARLASGPLGSMSYTGYRGSGFQCLFNVRRAQMQGHAVCEWRMTEPGPGKAAYPWEGIGLKAHLVGRDEEIIACEGKPQKYSYLPDTLQFMIRRRTGADLSSRFVTVYEPYKDKALIDSVGPVALTPDDGNAVAARIALADGTAHYVFHSLTPGQTYTLDGELELSGQAACIQLDANRAVSRAMLLNGERMALGAFEATCDGPVRTTITSVDYDAGVVTLAEPVLGAGLQQGQTVLVAPRAFADCLTVDHVIDERSFSVGDEDMLVAGGPVTEVEPDTNRIVSPVTAMNAAKGMTLLNSLNQPQGRVVNPRGITLDRGDLPPLSTEDFPTAPGDSTRRYRVVMAGPGDEVIIPSLLIVDEG